MKAQIFNVPNLISVSRILVLPFFAYLIIAGFSPWASALLAIIGFSDIYDGYYARKHKLVTRAGKILDPIADKLVLTVALVYLGATNPSDPLHIPPLLSVLLLCREFMASGLRSIAAAEGFVFGASKAAKYKTVLQFVGLCWVLGYHSNTAWLHPNLVGLSVLWIAVILSYYSLFKYFVMVFQKLEKA